MAMILDGTNGAFLPTWTTSTRPASPANGEIGYNSTTGLLDQYVGGAWASIASSSVSLSSANTWTGTQTFNGSSSTFGVSLLDANESVNVVASSPSSTTNFYVGSGSVQYYTSNASNNWTLNVAFSAGTTLNSALTTGQSVTIALLTTQGSTAYYQSAMTIDGVSVTPKWQGGTAPTSGNASGIDAYVMTIVKTASATYTVLASQTKFA